MVGAELADGFWTFGGIFVGLSRGSFGICFGDVWTVFQGCLGLRVLFVVCLVAV